MPRVGLGVEDDVLVDDERLEEVPVEDDVPLEVVVEAEEIVEDEILEEVPLEDEVPMIVVVCEDPVELDEMLIVEEIVDDELLAEVGESIYNSNLFPAPQYSY
jgi:hypothetical protein